MLGAPTSLRLAGNPRGMSKARVTNHQNTTTFITKPQGSLQILTKVFCLLGQIIKLNMSFDNQDLQL